MSIALGQAPVRLHTVKGALPENVSIVVVMNATRSDTRGIPPTGVLKASVAIMDIVKTVLQNVSTTMIAEKEIVVRMGIVRNVKYQQQNRHQELVLTEHLQPANGTMMTDLFSRRMVQFVMKWEIMVRQVVVLATGVRQITVIAKKTMYRFLMIVMDVVDYLKALVAVRIQILQHHVNVILPTINAVTDHTAKISPVILIDVVPVHVVVLMLNVQRGIVALILNATHANHQTIVVRG